MKNDIYDLPEELLAERDASGNYSENAFAHFDNYGQSISQLAALAEDEDWSYHHSQLATGFQYPILSNYYFRN